MKNKYIRRARISEAKFRKLLQCFALDLEAKKIAALTCLNRNTVNRYLKLIRKRIAEFCEKESSFICRFVAAPSVSNDKDVVFGIFLKGDKVFTEPVPTDIKATCRNVVHGNLSCELVSDTNNWREYDCLVDFYCKKYFRFPNVKNETEKSGNLSRIESFWAYLTRRLMKFNGVPLSTFYLHLKESEFRFNYASQDIYGMLLKMFRDNPLF